MTLRFHNTLTGSLDEFISIIPNKVALYTCGPTVYDYPHIGNWSGYIYWDTLVRLLRINGYDVTRVMNITDVGHLVSDGDTGEDKLEKGAKREGKTAWEVAAFYTDIFLKGIDSLNLIKPEYITKATEYIPQQLDLVRKLKQNGFTYQIDDGIYFNTKKFPKYADFAHLDLGSQKAGARVKLNDQKLNPSDFALWKFSPSNEKRDMEWKTPVDIDADQHMGFPGWAIECSAMAMAKLGKTIDIHTGGIDHIPVHHTNEIAQSEAANGVRFSNYWLHNSFMNVNGVKFSKSLQNSYTLDDLRERGYSPLDFRMLVLQSHYRSGINFTFESLQSAKNRLHNWANVAALRHQIHDTLSNDSKKSESSNLTSSYATPQAIIEAANNDLGTPEVLKIIDDAFSKIVNSKLDQIDRKAFMQLIETIDNLLGLDLAEGSPDIDDEMKRKILERKAARNNQDWRRSDELRDEILKEGIILLDTKYGDTVWEYSN